MAETIIGVVLVFGALFILCKGIGKLAQFCAFDELVDAIGDSLTVGSGGFSSNRRD